MSKGFRALLHILQVLSLLGALLYLAMTHLEAYADWGLTDDERAFAPMWAVGLGVLSIAFSPALWSLSRAGGPGPAQNQGSYDRVAEPPPAAPPQPRPGSAFEPLGGDRAPAPPASSYGQPAGGGFGAPPQAGTSPQGESPWGSGR